MPRWETHTLIHNHTKESITTHKRNDYAATTTENSINNVQILHQLILAVMPHTIEYTCTIM